MTVPHSAASRLYVNGVDLSGFLNKAQTQFSMDKVDTSCFGATYKSYTPGKSDGSLHAEGWFDGTALAVTAQMEALFLLDQALFTHIPAGDALSNRCKGFAGFEAGFDITSDVTTAVKVAMDAQSETGPVPMIIGRSGTSAVSSIGTLSSGQSDDNLVPTTNGGELHYHVLSLGGTGSPTITAIRWQTAPDGSTWTTITPSLAASITSAPAYGRLVVPVGTTIDRDSRIQVVTTGSTISALVFASFARF